MNERTPVIYVWQKLRILWVGKGINIEAVDLEAWLERYYQNRQDFLPPVS